MRIIQEEGGKVTYYLDVAFRKLWFRLKYPEGKVVKKILKLTEQVAIVEAKVYLNRSDAEENFVSNAFAQKYFSAEDSLGSKYVELAETAAVGRALTDAGFGLQFSDRDGETDPQVTEAPFEAGMLFQEEGLPEGNFGNMGSTGDGFDASEWMMMDAQNGNDETEKKAKQNVTEIRKDMPVEQIYSLLTRDSAAAVVIPTKYYHGMTLGQLAIEKPQALEWYVTSYGGPDNLLRAAARFLLDTALKQAG